MTSLIIVTAVHNVSKPGRRQDKVAALGITDNTDSSTRQTKSAFFVCSDFVTYYVAWPLARYLNTQELDIFQLQSGVTNTISRECWED